MGSASLRAVKNWVRRAINPRPFRRPARKLKCERLEVREVPAALIGLDTNGTTLHRFDSATPGTITSVGVGYMLQGDRVGGSNTDPFATEPTADNQWVVSPPHVMVLTPDPRQLESLPTDPKNGGPWVMWKGTPYAHIMVPTEPMANATPPAAQ